MGRGGVDPSISGDSVLDVSGNIDAELLGEQLEHLSGFGVAANFLLGKDQLIVHGDVKDPFASTSNGQRFDDMLIIGQQVLCRAHGAVRIVSSDAVIDHDFVHSNLQSGLLHLRFDGGNPPPPHRETELPQFDEVCLLANVKHHPDVIVGMIVNRNEAICHSI